VGERHVVGKREIAAGLRALGLDETSAVIVHASLRSFGRVEGGARAVCEALLETCGTVLMPAFSWDLTGVPAPPGLERPANAAPVALSWAEFESALARAVPFSDDLPIDREIGLIPETLRRELPHHRSRHPLISFIAAGRHAAALIGAARLDWPLGPIEALAGLGGDVLLLGVGHTSDTTIHLAEQRLGCARFYRYAKLDQGVWAELPNIPGCSDGFDRIEPALAARTREVAIGACRARRVAVADVLATATRLIEADPTALHCSRSGCGRCPAAVEQRLAWLRR
jgi:aminoglycoside 3-N-acetyltransferase